LLWANSLPELSGVRKKLKWRSSELERLYSELRDAFDRASQAEALRRSEKLKSALLDAVTHDLRTPLASVKASITTLLDEARGSTDGGQPVVLDPESRLDMMEVIDQESDRLNRFIGDLIELARIEAGELQLRPRWGTVDEIISTALTRAEPLTAQHKIEVEIEKDLPLVRVDNRAVSEVVYSLIDMQRSIPLRILRSASSRAAMMMWCKWSSRIWATEYRRIYESEYSTNFSVRCVMET
jgi:K+-sensing histidine kinase KdpD